jgi:hypothetical protein
LSCRVFQLLPPPDPLHPLGVDAPAVGAQQCGDAPIAVAAICASQPDDRLTQCRFIIADLVRFALGRTWLTDSPAGPPFRDRFLEPAGFPFQVLQPPRLLELQPTLFTPPAVITLFRDAQTATHLTDPVALRQFHFGLVQQTDDLFRRVSLSLHS